MKLSAILVTFCAIILFWGGTMQLMENGQLPQNQAAAASPALSPTPTLSPSATPVPTPSMPNREEAFLELVNVWNPIPSDGTVNTTALPNGQLVATVCYEDLLQMLTDCTAAGGDPEVCSGYRTYEMQLQLYENKVERVMDEGYSRTDAEAIAARSVAYPGTSEHHTGLAADIIDAAYPVLNESQAERPTQQWLLENCWKYGFILRYPSEKSDWTAIVYEPWHYRYVGREMAKFMYEQDLCLEELYVYYLQA